MADRCDKCGAVALENERFTRERYPFWGPKRYCPSCYRRWVMRMNVWVFGMLGLLAGYELWKSAKSGNNWLKSGTGWWASFILLQLVFVLPHELGHALVARWLRFDKIRIVIGSGKPLFTVRFLGFPWVFRLFPFGGLTLVEPAAKAAAKGLRWRYLALVLAGPMINFGLALAAWCLVPRGTMFEEWTWTKVILAANLYLVLVSLVPYNLNTTFGCIPSDGLQIWNLLFRWKKPMAAPSTRIPTWQIVLCYVLKYLLALVTFAGVLLFLFIGWWLISETSRPTRPEITAIGLVFDLGFVVMFGWMTFRLIKEPVAKQKQVPPSKIGQINMHAELNAEQWSMYKRMCDLFNRKEFKEAECASEPLLASLADRNGAAYAQVLLIKLATLVRSGNAEKAEAVCVEFVRAGPATTWSIQLLDGLACELAYPPATPDWPAVERLARLALELSPGTPTVKGTLGMVLVEQGRYEEAEPLLQQCLEQSDAVHDQAISSFYLGLLREAAGRVDEAKRLMKRAAVLYPVSWLTEKVEARLRALP